jgi:hypothetical protein
MAHNMDMKKGLYPDEPGYSDWNIGDFKKELGIEGTLTKEFNYIQPSKFHQKLMKTGDLPLGADISYTDILVRNDLEMSKNKRYFQPKAWNVPKLMFNYHALYQLLFMELQTNKKLFDLMKWHKTVLLKHIKFLYFKYKVAEEDQSSKREIDEV